MEKYSTIHFFITLINIFAQEYKKSRFDESENKKQSRLKKQPSHVAELRKRFLKLKYYGNELKNKGTHSSVVEHSTADREVSGSNPLGS